MIPFFKNLIYSLRNPNCFAGAGSESFNHSGPQKSVRQNYRDLRYYFTPHLIGVRNNIAGLLPVVPAGGASRRLVVGVAESAAVVRAARRRRLTLVVVNLPPLM
jgi:hypothetical protein